MVDRLRAYRRWCVRHLALVVPAMGVALGSVLWFALVEAPAWLRVACLTAAFFSAALLGFFLVQTILCDRAHRRGGPHARLLRAQLRPHAAVALASILVLGLLALVPGLFRPPAATVPTPPPAAARAKITAEAGRLGTEPAPGNRWTPVPEKVEAPVEFATLPRTMKPWVPPEVQEDLPGESPEDRQDPREKPGLDDLQRLRDPDWVVRRRGLPEEDHPAVWPPIEARLDLFLLYEHEGFRSGGIEFVADVPFSRRDSVRFGAWYATFGEVEFWEDADFVWEGFRVEYVRRLTGFAAESRFDLAVSAGLRLDFFRGEEFAGAGRLSPEIGLDVGIWPAGSLGLLLHIGQSFPLRIEDSSAWTTEIAAIVRLDLSDSASIHAGYRHLFVRLRHGGEAEFEAALSGPLLGIDLRF